MDTALAAHDGVTHQCVLVMTFRNLLRSLLLFFISCGCSVVKAQQRTDVMLQSHHGDDELSRHHRYSLALQQKKDSLKFVLHRSVIVGVRYGQFIVPGYIKTDNDSLTGTDISASRQTWTLYGEYVASPHWAFGLDLTMHSVEQVQEVKLNSGAIHVKGSGGKNFNMLFTGKYIWGKAGQWKNPNVDESHRLIFMEKRIAALEQANNRSMRQFRWYTTFGGGLTQTVLLKVKGKPGSLKKNNYKQAVPTVFIGAGAFSRISSYVIADLGFRYVVSKPYDPTIGGVTAYTGFTVQLSVGILLNNHYKKVKSQLIESGY